MKNFLLAITAATLFASTSLAGNWFGSGPWANGAYYPGQYNGVYSASIYGGNPGVVSGVLGFGLDNGAPSTNAISTNILTSINNAENYFVVYVNGQSYVGQTIANVNVDSSQVSGGLANGQGEPTFSVLVTTNKEADGAITTTVTQLTVFNTCGGAFNANLTGKKSVVTFEGINSGTLATAANGFPNATNTFSLNGMKVGN